VVYFVSCVNRTLAEGRDGAASVAEHTLSLFAKAGFAARYPDNLDALCCGQPFDSKNAADAAELASSQTAKALLAASDNGRIPVYIDNGPCAERLITAQREGRVDARLKLYDAASFLSEFIAPRLNFTRQLDQLALHVPCSASKLGVGGKLTALARRCATQLSVPDIACCGFAGDKGFTTPELNANSLKRLQLPAGCAHGVSMSRTCQIGLTTHTGVDYQSIEALLDACSDPA
jgi:D-lactate dehydrogenase